MKKYKVYGTTTVTVTKEVWALDEDDAYKKADMELSNLTAFCGNGGDDKLIGVYEMDESISADDCIVYDDIELLEDDPNYFACPECGEECEQCEQDDGTEYWYCPDCCAYYDEDGDEFYPDVDEEED